MEDEVLDTQNEAPSMDDTIRATLAEINARGETEEVETPEVIDEPEETAEETETRARDEKGRFASKTEEAPETPAEPEPESVEDEPLPPEVQRLGLRKEEAAEWKKASPVLQQALLRRSEEMHRGLEQYRAPAQFGQRMVEAFKPYEQTLQQLNVPPDVAVVKLLQVDSALRYGSPEQKAATIANLAHQFGVDLGMAQTAPLPDQNYIALQNQIQQLQGFINEQQRTQAEREQEALNSELSSFAQGREHFETVREDMAALLQAGRATDLNDAYEKAIWANPSVRAALIAKQQSEASAKAEKERKAQEARKANAVNVSRRGTVPAGATTGTMEDTIRATAQKLGLIQH